MFARKNTPIYWFRSITILLLVGLIMPSASALAQGQGPSSLRKTAATQSGLTPLTDTSAWSSNPVSADLSSDNLIQDGSFEAYDAYTQDDPYWTEYDSYFGTPLCNGDDCGFWTIAHPYNGYAWAWFGDASVPTHTASLKQGVFIPQCTSATLQFYFWIGYAPSGSGSNDVFRAKIDGVTVFSATAAQKNSYPSYQLVTVNVGSFADGYVHTLEFSHTNTVQAVTFNLDDVSLVTTCVTIAGNAGTSGVTLNYNDGTPKTVTSEPDGFYLISVPAGWTGTVTPSHPCFTFSPTSLPYNFLTTSLWSGQDYAPTFNSGAGCANVNVKIGVNDKGTYGLPAVSSVAAYYYGVFDGPVKVTSSTGQSIFATERTYYGGTFHETTGIPDYQLTTDYWFPWYDYSIMQTWISVGNPSPSQTANVSIYIAGQFKGSTSIPANGRWTPSYPGVFNGPVEVKSTQTLEAYGGQSNTAGIPIMVSERTLYGQNFNETNGIPNNRLASDYWFPWYDFSIMQTWISVGNPSPTQIAHVSVYIAGQFKGSQDIAPSGRWTPSYPGEFNGPVQVKSTDVLETAGGQSNTPGISIIATERTLYGMSFNETPGVRTLDLTTDYWLPTYDSSGSMQTWLSVGNPDTTQAANVSVYIAGQFVESHVVAASGKWTPIYPGTLSGPVEVKSTAVLESAGNPSSTPGNPVFFSARTLRGTSFSETNGIPANQLDSIYWFPWYDFQIMQTWLHIGRP